MESPHTEPLTSLASTWRRAIRPGLRLVAGAVVALAVVVAFLVARSGTTKARLGAVAMVLGAVLVVAVGLYLERRLWSDPRRVIQRLAARIDPDRAARALRALSLLTPDGEVARADGISGHLARLHVARALAALPADRISARAARVAFRLDVLGASILIAAICAFGFNAWSVFEGVDVLFARGGVGAFPMTWLDVPDVQARVPEYVHREREERSGRALAGDDWVKFGGTSELPFHSLLTFRGKPAHASRRVLLTDGMSEIPFVDDGAGHIVARWPLTESVRLRVVARFGDVLIEESAATVVKSIADEAPVVKLEGAPRQIVLASDEDDGDVPLRYEASDDHGLREIHLVLRSGTREERRVLARLDGGTRYDRGGHVLRVRDPFVRKSHAPVEIVVEAKDNDPFTGPKWGRSFPITLVPPDVGEPEARRLDALRRLRDATVDMLAWRLSHELPADAQPRQAYLADALRRQDAVGELLETTLASTFAGVRVPGRLQAILRGQMRKLKDAVDAESKAPNSATRAGAVKGAEKMVLVVDAIVRGLGQRDTRDASKQLAEVADDLALGASQILRGAEKERGTVRMGASTHVLSGGSRSLKRLGALGRDIGEIVEVDLLRVGRASGLSDFMHAELAARDLAARLREPDPSFASSGRSGSGRGGGESGGGRGTAGDEPSEPDEASQAFNEAAQELEKLAQEHAGKIGDVEKELNGAATEDEIAALKEEAKKHAQAIREATKGLPSVGGGSESWTGKGAAGKEHAEQMAKSLEDGAPADAVASGKSALQALDEAKRLAARERWLRDGTGDIERRIDEAKKKLEAEQKWSEQQLEQLRKRAAERASKQLEKHGEDEGKLGERARKLGEKGRDTGAMPQPALEALDDAERAANEAAQALKKGDADKALEKQREAQRKLEAAKQALGDQSQGDRNGDADEGNPALDHADIPKADAHKGPEEFRKRVIKGLGQPSSGRLKDAVRRYAEGLLR